MPGQGLRLQSLEIAVNGIACASGQHERGRVGTALAQEGVGIEQPAEVLARFEGADEQNQRAQVA